MARFFLSHKQETGEVCAFEKMRKCTLFKMDQIRHVLVERDILTATKTPWLVRLLYALRDTQYTDLAMEYVPGGDFCTLLALHPHNTPPSSLETGLRLYPSR
ncbi:hypothetical protein BDZ89DRAFT_965725 [Hymenopellis radicata]|nr:hypothetical protein BDZ89DRAFT_965725 [Hymenopellis radicata]